MPVDDVAGPPIAELRRDLGLVAAVCDPRPGGFASECWVLDERWFVKARPAYSGPVDLTLLGRLADTGLPVVPAVHDRELWTDDGRLYSVFPYIRGRHATGEDWSVVARALRRVHDTSFEGLGLPTRSLADVRLDDLRERLDHRWIRLRAAELEDWLKRFDAVVARCVDTEPAVALSHDDLGGHNLLLGESGEVVAMLDWDYACVGPREHDLWMVLDEEHPRQFLDAYDLAGVALAPDHLEYGLLRRALGDIAARVCNERDQQGIETWGFTRLGRVDATLALFAGQ